MNDAKLLDYKHHHPNIEIADQVYLPFPGLWIGTRIKYNFLIWREEEVERAKNLLLEIKPLIDEKEATEEKRRKNNSDVLV